MCSKCSTSTCYAGQAHGAPSESCCILDMPMASCTEQQEPPDVHHCHAHAGAGWHPCSAPIMLMMMMMPEPPMFLTRWAFEHA